MNLIISKHYLQACRFYKFKTKYPVYCLGITLPEIRKVYEAEVITFVPTRCPNGERIMIIHPGTKWNPKEISVTELIRAVFIMVEVPMIEPRTQVGGVHIILDMKGLSLGHITQFTPRLAQIILEFVQVMQFIFINCRVPHLLFALKIILLTKQFQKSF